ncbi:MAG: hypothetical protein KY462_13995 [Actinobacteria bacterium]|nr:hypothetical protein [Actinomycetota bacterium]
MTGLGSSPITGEYDRGRLLARAQHDYNAQVAIAHGWAETLTRMWDSFDDAERRGAVARIEQAIGRIDRLATGVFAEARADELARTVSAAPLDARIVVDPTGHRDRRVRSLPDRPVPVLADRTVLGMLIDDLVAAQQAGAPPDTITELAVETTGDRVELVVRTPGGQPSPPIDADDPLGHSSHPTAVLRLLASRVLADAIGAELIVCHDGAAAVATVQLARVP